MRAAVLLSVVVLSSACQGPKGEPGPAGPPGPTGLTGATGPKSEGVDVPALMARVDMLEKKLAATKVPHLIVKATGEDLGPSLGGFCFYSAKLDGEICLPRTVSVYFSGDKCTGKPFIRATATRQSALYAGIATYLRPMISEAREMTRSYIDQSGACIESPEDKQMIPLVDTGVPLFRYQLSDVEITLR